MKTPRQIIAIILSLVSIVCLLAGCGEQKEKSRAEKARDKGVEICEKYLDFEINQDEAKQQLKDLSNSLESTGAELSVKVKIDACYFHLLKDDIAAFKNDYNSLKNFPQSMLND